MSQYIRARGIVNTGTDLDYRSFDETGRPELFLEDIATVVEATNPNGSLDLRLEIITQ